jgi:hypothetical protein
MAGTVTQSRVKKIGDSIRVVTFTCVGDSADGTIPDTDISDNTFRGIAGFFLDTVSVNPGATAPDAADLSVKDVDGIDLLDGNGAALIHATNSLATVPATDGQVKVQPIYDTITLSVANQATVDATYTVKMVFVRA